MKEGSKYHPLYRYLCAAGTGEVVCTFAEIEKVLGTSLPPSARTSRAWWSNRHGGSPQAAAWVGAGYHAVALDLAEQTVTFRKPQLTFRVRRERGHLLWNGAMVKALRQHMGVSQAELADQLGMRQQTISEWEVGKYEPSRASSKFLTLIAERVAFPYDVGHTEV